MPFKSQAQRRFMYANYPKIAKRWSKHTPKDKKLPEHVNESIEVGPNLQFIKGKTLEVNNNKISLSYKVKSQKAVELKVIYDIDKGSLESTITKNKKVSWNDIEPFIDFSYFVLRDYNNVTNKGIDKGIKSENPQDIEGHFGLTEEDLNGYISSDAPVRILTYFSEKRKVLGKEVGIEESLEFEALCTKILSE